MLSGSNHENEPKATIDQKIGHLVSIIKSERGTRARRNKRINKLLDKLNDTIYGNGAEGLKTKVSNNRRDINQLFDEFKEFKESRKSVLPTILAIASVIIALIALFLK